MGLDSADPRSSRGLWVLRSSLSSQCPNPLGHRVSCLDDRSCGVSKGNPRPVAIASFRKWPKNVLGSPGRHCSKGGPGGHFGPCLGSQQPVSRRSSHCPLPSRWSEDSQAVCGSVTSKQSHRPLLSMQGWNCNVNGSTGNVEVRQLLLNFIFGFSALAALLGVRLYRAWGGRRAEPENQGAW